jgi:hypothetical protein
VTPTSRWIPLLAVAGLAALPGCTLPPQQSAVPLHTGQIALNDAACLAPLSAVSNAPIIRDGQLRIENDAAVLSGCVINPGPREYRLLDLEFAFFDAQGRLLSAGGDQTSYLPPYSATPASPSGAPRWLEPFDIQSEPSATQAQIMVHAILCSSDGKSCSEEHGMAVVPRTGP